VQSGQPDIGAVLNASPSDIGLRSRFQFGRPEGAALRYLIQVPVGTTPYRAALRQKSVPPDQHGVSEHVPRRNHRHQPNAPQPKLWRVISICVNSDFSIWRLHTECADRMLWNFGAPASDYVAHKPCAVSLPVSELTNGTMTGTRGVPTNSSQECRRHSDHSVDELDAGHYERILMARARTRVLRLLVHRLPETRRIDD
jgi:hypothetical protein